MDKDKTQHYEETINIIIIGDAFVGKTSLMKRFTENSFSDNILGTVGIECHKKTINIKNTEYLIKIWDTCGQERLKSLTLNYYRNADGIMLVFDVNEPESFDNLKGWVTSITENLSYAIPRVVVANKIDLDKRVSASQIKTFQKQNKVEVFECSAKSGTHVKDAFMYIFNEVIKNKKEKNNIIVLGNKINEDSNCSC